MRWRWICLALATISFIPAGAANAVAQTPALYNYNRAYQHFLGSRYSYRTLYSSVPGSGSMMATPFFYQSRFIEPSFSRQRIWPYGYDRFDLIPGFGSAAVTPFGFANFYTPGYGRGFVAPYGAPPFEYFTP
jgi:hypothetical protein